MRTTSLAETISSPEMHRWETVLLVAEGLVIGWLLATEGVTGLLLPLVAVMGAVALGLLVSRSWPLGALSVLMVGGATPRFAASLFGLHVRPEHVAIAGVLCAVAVRFAMSRTAAHLGWLAADYALAAYLALNFVSSAFCSLEPWMTLRWATMNAIVIIAYFLIRLLVTGGPILHRAFDFLLWAGALEAAYGVICFLSNRAFGTEFGIATGQYGLIPGTHGTQYEANLFGSYTASCAVMFLAVLLAGRESRRGAWTLVGLVLCAAGTLVSLSRTALAGMCVVMLLVFVFALRKGRVTVRRLALVICSFGMLLLAVSPFIGSLLEDRFSTIDLSEISSDPTAWVRIVSLGAAIDDIQVHPLLGTGTDSLQLTFNMRDYIGHPSEMDDLAGWVSNAPVRILHDTGVAGLVSFLAFLTMVAVATVRALRLADGHTRTVVAALAAGLLVYAITFQTTEATLLAFPWVQAGLLAAALGILRNGAVARESSVSLAGHPR